MATKTNLLNRNGRWYFNKAFPKHLWSATPGTTFRRSLRTDSLEVAQRRRPEADQEYWAAVRKAEQQIACAETSAAGSGRLFTQSDVTPVLAQWYHSCMKGLDEHWQKSFDQNEFMEAERNATAQLADAKQEAATGQYWDSRTICKKLIKDAGFESSEIAARRQLEHLVARGRVEMLSLELARYSGNFGYQVRDPEIAALADVTGSNPNATKKTIGDLIDAYRASEEDRWSPSTQSSYKPIWRLLDDALGRDQALSDIGRPTGRELFDLVKKLPKNMGKKKELKDLSVPDAVKAAERRGFETISPKTINGTYMGFLSTIFKWAVKEQWMDSNPVEGLSVQDDVAPSDKRDPFTPEQLRKLFSLPPWTPKDAETNPLRYWGPLIALYQGMRRGEIAQLDTADVETVEGILVIHVRDDGDGKRVKTVAGRRTLPVHRELLCLGFGDYVDQRQRSRNERLFEGQKPNGRGQWGTSLTNWFTRLLKDHGFEGQMLGLHSFRHNFEDRLRAAELHGTDIGRELAGRSTGKDTSSSYGSGYSLRQLKAAMDRIDYNGAGFLL